jgi:hypothetical protein
MKNTTHIFLYASLALLSACASVAPKPPAPPVVTPSPSQDGGGPAVELIDHDGLQRSLGMERSVHDLGYDEKAFSTCGAGYGYSSSRNCRREHFVLVHFQLLCRDSEGTVSTAIAVDELMPLRGRTVNWTLKGRRGRLNLDGEGRGQIRTTLSGSQREQRLRLAVDNDFLYIRAGDAKRLVTPKQWCNID